MSSSSLQAGIVLSNRYLILYKIGSGTFTSIYSAFDLQTKMNVAIKVENVAPQIKKGSVIDKEAQVLKDLQGALHCPSFQEYHIKGTSSASTNTLCFIAFELIAGEDMHSLRTRSATANQENSKQKKSRFLPINISSALHLSLQMLDCVQSVHEKGYLHRDVKPSNFVRTGMNEDEREFKIIDFGLSKSFVQSLEPNSPPLSPQIPFKTTPPNTTNPLAYSSQTLYLKPRKPSAQFRGTTMYASVNVQSELDHSRSDDIFGVVYSLIDLVNGDLPWRPYATGEGKDKETVKTMKEAGLSDPRNMMVDPLIRSLGNFNHWIWQISNYLTTLDFYSTPDYGSIKKWMINACHEQGNGLVGNTVWKGGKMKKAIDLVWECNDNRRQEALGIRLQEGLIWRKNKLMMEKNLLYTSTEKRNAWNIGANYVTQRQKLDLQDMTFLRDYADTHNLIKHFKVLEGERNAITSSSINKIRLEVLIKEKKKRKKFEAAKKEENSIEETSESLLNIKRPKL